MKRKLDEVATSKEDRRTKIREGQTKSFIISDGWICRPHTGMSFKVQTLEDLLNVAWNYKGSSLGEGDHFDWMTLWLLIPALIDLHNLVGMNELKQGVTSQVLYFIQNLDVRGGVVSHDFMLHTILSGPSGCGKSEVVKILARIYRGLDLIPLDKVLVTRRDALAVLGEKTVRELLTEAKGGILFVDESPTLGGLEKGTDGFASTFDILNNRLAVLGKDAPICIMGCTPGEMEKYLFFVSSGIKTSFPWHYSISRYSPAEMVSIFKCQVKKDGWNVEEGAINERFFVRNMSIFPANGRDICNLFLMCKMAHSKRLFSLPESPRAFVPGRRTLTKTDITSGLEKYRNGRSSVTSPIDSYFG
jgi:hypothetical protein